MQHRPGRLGAVSLSLLCSACSTSDGKEWTRPTLGVAVVVIGMDPPFAYVSREELWRLVEEMKTVHAVQGDHAERLGRLERRQEDDARLKSVWGTSSPFPSVLSGTPQHEPIPNAPGDEFTNFDETHQHTLLGSLSLDHEEEPRRGASRANSVRFDESAKHGHWPRSSGEFFPPRTGSGLGSHPMTERSLSHKSDGRQSSAGHSVHSVHSIHSAVSVPSARTSSLGIDTAFPSSHPLGTSSESAGPPPGLFILGTVPSIIRCWLDTNFSHDTLLYAAVCSGSYDSFLDLTLVKDLGLADALRRTSDGRLSLKLPVYLPEAVIQQASRSSSPSPQLPSISVHFAVNTRPTMPDKSIRVFIGSDALRVHHADILLSQNCLSILGDDHSRLTVPLVRPEEESLFRSLRITSIGRTPQSEDTEDQTEAIDAKLSPDATEHKGTGTSMRPSLRRLLSSEISVRSTKSVSMMKEPLESAEEEAKSPSIDPSDGGAVETDAEESKATSTQKCSNGPGSEPTESPRRDGPGAIWGSWRREQGAKSETANGGTTSGATYQRAGRGRGMKVLRPSRSSISSPRNGAPSSGGSEHDTPLGRDENDPPRRSQDTQPDEAPTPLPAEVKTTAGSKESRSMSSQTRVTNPIGGASAFAWLNGGPPKRSATTAE
ncbi:MAG: hypothetical protein M1838_004533 [Thelocarpon superellum]|nr:MAG: hypothetical protein M1838_004533 [Thelocarpon superellum]